MRSWQNDWVQEHSRQGSSIRGGFGERRGGRTDQPTLSIQVHCARSEYCRAELGAVLAGCNAVNLCSKLGPPVRRRLRCDGYDGCGRPLAKVRRDVL